MAGTPLQIVVGLGNPGPEHRLTRHNAGFWFVDALAYRQGVQFRAHARYQGEIARVVVEGTELVLLKPQTYMNRSGLSIRALMDYIKAPVSAVLVVHDDLDLPCGVARLKLGGGHGGHNGLRDAITHCGADFWRLRLGVGHPGAAARAAGRGKRYRRRNRCRPRLARRAAARRRRQGDEPPAHEGDW